MPHRARAGTRTSFTFFEVVHTHTLTKTKASSAEVMKEDVPFYLLRSKPHQQNRRSTVQTEASYETNPINRTEGQQFQLKQVRLHRKHTVSSLATDCILPQWPPAVEKSPKWSQWKRQAWRYRFYMVLLLLRRYTHTHTQPMGLGVHGNFFAGARRIRKVVVRKVKGILYQVISSRSFNSTKSEVRISPAAEKSNKSTSQWSPWKRQTQR